MGFPMVRKRDVKKRHIKNCASIGKKAPRILPRSGAGQGTGASYERSKCLKDPALLHA
jgi:hypothetical protein